MDKPSQSWRRNWSRLTAFFDYPPEIRKVNRVFQTIHDELGAHVEVEFFDSESPGCWNHPTHQVLRPIV